MSESDTFDEEIERLKMKLKETQIRVNEKTNLLNLMEEKINHKINISIQTDKSQNKSQNKSKSKSKGKGQKRMKNIKKNIKKKLKNKYDKEESGNGSQGIENGKNDNNGSSFNSGKKKRKSINPTIKEKKKKLNKGLINTNTNTNQGNTKGFQILTPTKKKKKKTGIFFHEQSQTQTTQTQTQQDGQYIIHHHEKKKKKVQKRGNNNNNHHHNNKQKRIKKKLSKSFTFHPPHSTNHHYQMKQKIKPKPHTTIHPFQYINSSSMRRNGFGGKRNIHEKKGKGIGTSNNEINEVMKKYKSLGFFLMNLFSYIYNVDDDNDDENDDDDKEEGCDDEEEDNEIKDKMKLINKEECFKDPIMQKIFLCNDQFELIEKTRWFDELLRVMIVNEKIFPKNCLNDNLLFCDQITEKILHVISEKCSKNISLFRTCQPRVVIIGPKESGKSTVLHLFTKSLFDVFMNETNQWVDNFIMIVNWKNVVYPFSDLQFFYERFLKVLFQSLCVQRVNLFPYKDVLINYFANVVKKKKDYVFVQFSQLFKSSFKQELSLIKVLRDRIYRIWRDRKDLHKFLHVITQLPKLIGEIFGFSNCLFIFDNFDCCYEKLSDSSENSNQSTNHLSFYLKKMIIDQSYVITGSSKKFFSSLKRDIKNENDEIDLLYSSINFHVDGLIDVNKVDELPETITLLNTDYYTEYKHSKMIFIDAFKGCPAYLAHCIRFARLNQKNIDSTKSAPVPEKEVNTLLNNIQSFENEFKTISDHSYHVLASEDFYESFIE